MVDIPLSDYRKMAIEEFDTSKLLKHAAQQAAERAYNRWLVERVLAEEPRIRSMLYLPFNDPAASYRMVQEFAGKPGVVGFMVTAARYRPVHHNDYMKTYALLEERGL